MVFSFVFLLKFLISLNNSVKLNSLKLKIELANTKLELNNLKRVMFGTKREYTPETKSEPIEEQCSLFDNEEEIEKNVEEQIEEKVEEITVHRKKKSKEKKAGIKRSALKDVVILRKEYIIEDDAVCPECQSELKPVGKKIVRQEIEFEPAKLKIKEYVKTVYKCVKCGTKESKKESSTFVETEVPNALLTHSFVSPSLATEVISKILFRSTII